MGVGAAQYRRIEALSKNGEIGAILLVITYLDPRAGVVYILSLHNVGFDAGDIIPPSFIRMRPK